MDYNFGQDLIFIREILELSQDELASLIDVKQITISRSESTKTKPNKNLLEKVYSFAFSKEINLGRLKEMFWKESINKDHKLLFHGSKSSIKGPIDVSKGRKDNDFGQGFYTGETYVQAISFVSNFEKSSIYFIDFDTSDLKCKKYNVNQEWMMTIAYYRGKLEKYKNHPLIKKIIKESKNCDYIIAPIVDNRMFQIINSFINGEITDEQCKHCLAATNLGYQYVFKSKKSINNIKLIEKFYISENEREYYKNIKSSDTKLGDDKVKLALIQFRGKGHYIDEILQF